MPETIQTNTDNSTNYSKKTITAIQLVNSGLSPKEALKAVNYKKDIRPETVSRFKQKVNKYALSRPAMVKMAHNAIKDCLSDAPIINKRKDKQGKEIVEEIPPTWTNKIAAASMVYDRVEPIVRQNLNVNANMDVHPVDLSRWLNVQSGGDDRQMPTSDADYVDITSDQSNPPAK